MDYKEKVIALLDSKELSQEQKEKLESIFPELKESEDEKIRKCVTDIIKENTFSSIYGVTKEECLAWLEKQGGKDKLIKELGEYKIKYTQEVLEKHLNSMNNKDDERLRKTTISFLKDFADKGYENAVECIDWLEKQGNKPQGKTAREAAKEEKVDNQNCVKPDDKVEPKFHEGEWVVSPNGVYWHIDAIQDGRYQVSSDSGKCAEWPLDTNIYHRFTLQDAKDGDILSDRYSISIVIFRGIGNEKWNDVIDYHIGLFTNSQHLVVQKSLSNWGNINEVTLHPATKEQRDTLMKAMADNGYTFDFEKKELKKIEKKFAWSEEDEKMIKTVIANIKAICKEGYYIGDVNSNELVYPEQLFNWLLSLKDRIQPQPKQEWSEEDENRINRLIAYFEDKESFTAEDDIVYANWLKSLRPQSQWKPSDEQMLAINTAINVLGKGTLNGKQLIELREELQKLRKDKL